MKRIRIVLAGVLLASVLSITGAPAASAAYCPPEEDPHPSCRCGNESLDGLWRKLTGENLFRCPW